MTPQAITILAFYSTGNSYAQNNGRKLFFSKLATGLEDIAASIQIWAIRSTRAMPRLLPGSSQN